jgi:hypothetical protein
LAAWAQSYQIEASIHQADLSPDRLTDHKSSQISINRRNFAVLVGDQAGMVIAKRLCPEFSTAGELSSLATQIPYAMTPSTKRSNVRI